MGKHKPKKDKAERQQARRRGWKKGADDDEVDEETVAQVTEIEERLRIITQEMKVLETKFQTTAMEGKRAALTGQQLEAMPDNTTLYRQVGRVFVLTQKGELKSSMQAQEALKTLEGQQAKAAHTKLETKMRSEAENLRELLGPERMKKVYEAGGTRGLLGGAGDISNTTGEAAGQAASGSGLMPIWGAPAKASAGDAGDAAAAAGAAEAGRTGLASEGGADKADGQQAT
mmetsp:Transcript_55682/g.120304  ORF Transcript_55682/g.120304 Transcript_55682/m.120304 type:complete len:230 (-) Transcript_55682:89-778(-)|eukprot:CAMPEP_0170601080 /NCGR_PEP_ID=MMETSP0224-20130122/17672_1 /TAXON_ID=285029 /ORGANISM="Togula jolla, Strain CCCM 725" /LENGTH=229 /DNA_ID=CAMNT_0010925839 /DNA_START=112 /DNA_END=801 /DNA_ORIENTATION=+